MRHAIELESWEYEHLDYYKNPTLFVEDSTKEKYSIMDIVEIKDIQTNVKQTRVIKAVLFRDKGMKENYSMLTLGEKANFDECLITAVLTSVGTTREEIDEKNKNKEIIH